MATLIQLRANGLNDLFVGEFTMPTHAVTPVGFPSAGGKKQRIDVVFHVQTIAHIQSIAIG